MLLANTANSGNNLPIYDPATAVSQSVATLTAMTAFDTTNLRYTFTAPANGAVMVRIRTVETGGANGQFSLFGILQGSTVIARQAPVGGLAGTTGGATTWWAQEALFTVTGLTPGNVYTWDAAYAVQYVISAGNFKYGGPNDTAQNDAWGGITYEIHDAPNLNCSVLYDPATAVQKNAFTVVAMTALDTTNLRQTFTPPTSGNVFVRLRWCRNPEAAATYGNGFGGILSGSTVIARQAPIGAVLAAPATGIPFGQEVTFTVTGLSGNQTWDAAYAVQKQEIDSLINYGGPNDNAGADAYGAYLFEIWNI